MRFIRWSRRSREASRVETINFMITGVGGQGTILASDILAAVGMRAGYNVKKSDILGLAVRGGAVLLNQQEIHPASVSSGLATYPDEEAVQKALRAAVDKVYRVPGLTIAQELGSAKVLNVVLLGALSSLLSLEPEVWEDVLRERVPPRYAGLNLQAFHGGRSWMEERM